MVIFQRFTLKSLVESIQTRKKVQRPTFQTQKSLGTSRELKILHSETFLDHQKLWFNKSAFETCTQQNLNTITRRAAKYTGLSLKHAPFTIQFQ